MNNACEVSLNDLISLQSIAKKIKYSNNQFSKILIGENITRTLGRGMEYAESRVYQPGDDVRHMDWRVTARHSKPHTKLYNEEKGENTHIILDLGQSMAFGTEYALKSVIASKIAAVIAWASFQQNHNISGIIFNHQKSEFFKSKNTKKHVLSILNVISKLQPVRYLETVNDQKNCQQLNLSDILEKDKQLTLKGNRIYIISDFFNLSEKSYQTIQKLSYSNLISLIRITDPIEYIDLPNGDYNISNGNLCHIIKINNKNKNLLRDFFNKKIEVYKKVVKDLKIKSLDISNNQNWHNDLLLGSIK